MLLTRFSNIFPTFFDWSVQAKNTSYARRIKRLHYWYPNATLPQLSGREKLPDQRLSLHLVNPRGLNSKQRLQRNGSLFVLNKIRRGENPNSVINFTDLSKKELLKNLGDSIKFKDNSIKVTKSDKIPREMIISESGKELPIILKNSKDASIVGKYQNAKRSYLETGDPSKLKEFSKTKLKDIDGKIHKLETNPEKIIEIEDRKEEPEAFEIYAS